MALSEVGLLPAARPNAASGGAKGLSAEQLEGLAGVLASYDAKTMNPVEAAKIVTQVADLNILNGRGLENALANAGFDAAMAGVFASASAGVATLEPANATRGMSDASARGESGSPTARGRDSVDPAAVATLQRILEELPGSDGADQDRTAQLTAAMLEAGLDPTKPVVDFRA